MKSNNSANLLKVTSYTLDKGNIIYQNRNIMPLYHCSEDILFPVLYLVLSVPFHFAKDFAAAKVIPCSY
jgi:hypothetical protein